MSKDAKSNGLVELKNKYGFWLKPIIKLNITVQLPQLSTGKSISTTSVMEKITKRAKIQFKSLKITKTTIDFLRLEGELESLNELDMVEQRLNRVKIKLDGFDEQLKLKATRVKIGPFKHDWETFFRDNPQMDELKPGYRPDTVIIQNLPLKWFSNDDQLKTNWLISVFSVFGEIRRFHIPLLDEIEKEKQQQTSSSSKMTTKHQTSNNNKKDPDDSSSSCGFRKFNFNSDNATFDVYLMYKDYVGFVNAMDGLRGMKLIKALKSSGTSEQNVEYFEHDIKLDFDRTKHLSDKAIRRRQIAKKYGISTLEDLNEYKKKAKEKKVLYEQRMKQLSKYKKSSKNLLYYLARLVEIEDKKREEEEQRALNEKLLKERLIEEEKKLRNKLIERQRSLQIEKQMKEAEAHNSTTAADHRRSYDQNEIERFNSNDKNYRAFSQYDRHSFHNKSEYNEFNESRDHYRNHHHQNSSYESNDNYKSSSHHHMYRNNNYSNERKQPDFIFKNPNFTSNPHHNANMVMDYPNKPPFSPRLPNQRPRPYQTSSMNRNTYSHNNNHQQMPSNHHQQQHYYHHHHQNDHHNNERYGNRSNERPIERSNYNNQRMFNNYSDRSSSANYSDHRSYEDRNMYDSRTSSYRYRQSNSFDKITPNYDEEDDKRKDEKSLKSLIVLPKR